MVVLYQYHGGYTHIDLTPEYSVSLDKMSSHLPTYSSTQDGVRGTVEARDEWCVITLALDDNIHLLLRVFDATKRTLVVGVAQRGAIGLIASMYVCVCVYHNYGVQGTTCRRGCQPGKQRPQKDDPPFVLTYTTCCPQTLTHALTHTL